MNDRRKGRRVLLSQPEPEPPDAPEADPPFDPDPPARPDAPQAPAEGAPR